MCIWENGIKMGHNITIDNSFFERTEEFKYLGATKTYQNSFEEDMKSENAGYHSVQNLMSSSLLSKKLKINLYRAILLPVVLYGCKTSSLTLREKRRLRVYENRVLRGIFERKKNELTGCVNTTQ
jgi:hypothetical protein